MGGVPAAEDGEVCLGHLDSRSLEEAGTRPRRSPISGQTTALAAPQASDAGQGRTETRPPFGGYALAETAAKWRMSWPVI